MQTPAPAPTPTAKPAATLPASVKPVIKPFDSSAMFPVHAGADLSDALCRIGGTPGFTGVSAGGRTHRLFPGVAAVGSQARDSRCGRSGCAHLYERRTSGRNWWPWRRTSRQRITVGAADQNRDESFRVGPALRRRAGQQRRRHGRRRLWRAGSDGCARCVSSAPDLGRPDRRPSRSASRSIHAWRKTASPLPISPSRPSSR